MTVTVTAIHATSAAMPPVTRALAKLPGVHTLHFLDEALLAEVDRYGGVTPECQDRMFTALQLAAKAGSRGALVTCNVYSSVVDRLAATFAPMAVLSVDKPMVEAAVRIGRRIGVLATVASGLEQQMAFVTATARAQGKDVELVPALHEEAFAALTSGDPDRHDAILIAALPELAGQVDVVVLAQASMARLVGSFSKLARETPHSFSAREPTQGFPAVLGTPVLSSPDLAVATLARLVGLDLPDKDAEPPGSSSSATTCATSPA